MSYDYSQFILYLAELIFISMLLFCLIRSCMINDVCIIKSDESIKCTLSFMYMKKNIKLILQVFKHIRIYIAIRWFILSYHYAKRVFWILVNKDVETKKFSKEFSKHLLVNLSHGYISLSHFEHPPIITYKFFPPHWINDG